MEHARPPAELCLEGGPAARADAWRKWHQQFQVFLKASGVYKEPGDVKASLLVNLIGSDGYDVYSTFKYSKEEKKDDLDTLVKKFEEHFGTKKNITMARFKFFTKQQENGESIGEYVTALKLLSQPCEFEHLEEGLIRDRIVCGVFDSKLRDRLLRAEDLNLAQAVKICQAGEMSREEKRQIEGCKTEGAASMAVDTVYGMRGPRAGGGYAGAGRWAQHVQRGAGERAAGPAGAGERAAGSAGAAGQRYAGTGRPTALRPCPACAELEVWPRSVDSYNSWEQPVIQFQARDPGSWHPWVHRINEFLREYETTVPEDPPRAPCTTQRREQHSMRSDTCEIGMRMWAPCTADDFYGYAAGKPCVFLRLSHVHYWVPEPYNMSMSLPIPPEMPEHLRQIMHQRPAHQYGDFVWVSCEGEYSADQENIGPIQYIPANMPPGFPTSRLNTADRIPYSARGLPDQIPAPLVAVFFENPRRGVLINVECRIWTRDIYYDRSSRIGRARFELFIE